MRQDSDVTDFRCPTCKGAKWIDLGDLIIFEDQQLSVPCRTCGATGIYVSRERAGLVCEPVRPALAA